MKSKRQENKQLKKQIKLEELDKKKLNGFILTPKTAKKRKKERKKLFDITVKLTLLPLSKTER